MASRSSLGRVEGEASSCRARPFLDDDRHSSRPTTRRRWPYRDLHVLPKCRQKVHQAPHRHRNRLAAHQRGYLRLGGTQEPPSLSLGDAAPLQQAINLYGQLSFEQLLLGVSETKIGKHVAAAPFVIAFHLNDAQTSSL